MNLRASTGLLLLFTVSISPAFADDRDVLLESAGVAETRGDHAEAVRLLNALLALEPRDAHVMVSRGVAYFRSGDNLAAALDYSRALTLFALNDESARNRAIVLTNRADACLRMGDLSGALMDGFSARKIDPAFAPALTVIADTWYELGNLSEAQGFFAQARKLDPERTRDYTAEQAARNGQGRTQPDSKADINADFQAALEAYDAGDNEKALGLWDRVLALSPLNDAAWGNRGNALYALGRHAEAVISQSHAAAWAGAHAAAESTTRHLANAVNAWVALGDADTAVAAGELATNTDAGSAFAWARLANAYFEWGDADQATSAYTRAREIDSSLPERTFDSDAAQARRLGRLAQTGDPARLADLVDAAEHAHVGLFEENLARRMAIQILDRELARTPESVDLLVLRARAEDAASVSGFDTGASDEALAFLERALAVEPEHAGALALRGRFRLRGIDVSDEQTQDGYRDIDRAIELGARDPSLLNLRAAHRSTLGDHEGAIADLSAALDLKPDDAALRRARARAHEQIGAWDDALRDRDALVAAGESGAVAERAETCILAGRLEAALADFNEAAEEQPEDADVFLGRARVLRLLGRTDAARADHARARELDPLLPELAADLSNADAIEALRHDADHAMKRMANVFSEVSTAARNLTRAELEKERAERRLLRALGGDDRTPQQALDEIAEYEDAGIADARDHLERARAHANLEQIDEAMAALDRALALDPSYADAYDMRGRIHESRNELDLAFADYDLAVTNAPEDADYVRDRGDIWWMRENIAKAFADYDAAVRLGEGNALNWFKRGNANLVLGNLDAAVADYDKALELAPDTPMITRNRDIAVQRRNATR